MSRARRCPFCGAEAKITHVIYTDVWYVHCSECKAEMGSKSHSYDTSRGDLFFSTRDEAVKAWNRRVR